MTLTQKKVREALALAEKATPGPWRSMRDGNQYIETWYIPTAKCVGASRVEEIPRPWNPHQVIQFKKFDDAEVSRFLDADADFIAASRTGYENALRDLEEAMQMNGKQHETYCYVCRYQKQPGISENCEILERLRAYFEEE